MPQNKDLMLKELLMISILAIRSCRKRNIKHVLFCLQQLEDGTLIEEVCSQSAEAIITCVCGFEIDIYNKRLKEGDRFIVWQTELVKDVYDRLNCHRLGQNMTRTLIENQPAVSKFREDDKFIIPEATREVFLRLWASEFTKKQQNSSEEISNRTHLVLKHDNNEAMCDSLNIGRCCLLQKGKYNGDVFLKKCWLSNRTKYVPNCSSKKGKGYLFYTNDSNKNSDPPALQVIHNPIFLRLEEDRLIEFDGQLENNFVYFFLGLRVNDTLYFQAKKKFLRIKGDRLEQLPTKANAQPFLLFTTEDDFVLPCVSESEKKWPIFQWVKHEPSKSWKRQTISLKQLTFMNVSEA